MLEIKPLLAVLLAWSIIMVPGCTLLTDDKHVDYGALRKALIAEDDSATSKEINKMAGRLFPNPTKGDPTGHLKNFDRLIEQIEAGGNSLMSAEMDCYRCIETGPPITHVMVRLDSSNTTTTRFLDISTPEDAALRCVGVHR